MSCGFDLEHYRELLRAATAGGYRWTFFGIADVPLWSSVAAMAASIVLPLGMIVWMFRTGYRLKS